jgi:hypothetical protein
MTTDLLMKLVADLEIANLESTCLYEAATADSEYLPSYERHWAIREVINATPARTLPELRAKARAAEIALDLDADAACECKGSFVELSKSLISDLKAFAADTPSPLARKDHALRVVA